jgi:hypothetical protein
MDQTKWLIEGDDSAYFEMKGIKYATGDSGAPMLCSMLCKTQGRHVHVSACRAESPASCQEDGVEHINEQCLSKEFDWVSHKKFWERSGTLYF